MISRKRIAALFLALACLVSLFACSKGETEENAQPVSVAKQGESTAFGSYEQDNVDTNGKESIEWLVLKKEGDRALIISKYALDCKPYNATLANVTWESCSLRRWLNEDFFNAAFSDVEKGQILSTDIPYGTAEDGGELKCSDRVFLLSAAEVDEYFRSDSERTCQSTTYALAQGVQSYDGHKAGNRYNSLWWLRAPGGYANGAAYVGVEGAVYGSTYGAICAGEGVRPAVWIRVTP